MGPNYFQRKARETCDAIALYLISMNEMYVCISVGAESLFKNPNDSNLLTLATKDGAVKMVIN